MASKSQNKKKKINSAKDINIMYETPSASDLINELQYLLHCTSIRSDRLKTDPELIVNTLKNLTSTFENIYPFDLYYLLATSVVKLLQNIISINCADLTPGLLEAACQFYLHPNMKIAVKWFSLKGIHCFDALVNKTFIKSLGSRKECFRKLELLILTLIKKQVFPEDYVNKLFASVSKDELSPVAFAEISNMQKTFTEETAEWHWI